MILNGHVRDYFPRIALSLPGRDGSPFTLEFIVDTGFDGELAVPGSVIAQMDILESSSRPISLADGTRRHRPYHEILLDWDEGPRRTEILELEGNPLLGVVLLSDNLLQIEMIDGGAVLVEPL